MTDIKVKLAYPYIPRPLKTGIVIYTLPNNKYCERSLELCSHHNPVNVDCNQYMTNEKIPYLLEFIKKYTDIVWDDELYLIGKYEGRRIDNLFPFIFFGERFIGGYSELVEELSKELF